MAKSKKKNDDFTADIQADLDKQAATADRALPDLSGFKPIAPDIVKLDVDEWVFGLYAGSTDVEIEQKRNDGSTEMVNVRAHNFESAYTHDNSTFRLVSLIGGVALDGAIERHGVENGTEIFVRALGQRKTRGGNYVNRYEVLVRI